MKPITQIDIFSAIVLLTDETVVKRNESPLTPENPLEYPLGSSDRPDPEALLSVVLSLTGNYTLNVQPGTFLKLHLLSVPFWKTRN